MSFGMKTAPAEPAPSAGPTELGALLCATRMRLGKDLQRIAEVLHIRYTYLVAIEDGRYEDLPGQAYAIGFVRAYADHLGLDGDEIVRRYKEESAGLKHASAFKFPMPSSDSALPSGTLLLVAVLAGMVVYGGWYALAGSDRSAVEIIQAVPDRLAAIVDPVTIDAAAPVAAHVVPLTAADDTAEGADVPPDEGDPAPSAEAPVQAQAPAEAVLQAAALAVPVRTDVLELRAKADVWITLRDARAVERTQFLRKDEVLRLPEQGVSTLLTANAGDLEILVNGKALPPMDAGLFAKGVVLDPQRLRTAVPVSAVAAPPAASTPAASSPPAPQPQPQLQPAPPLSADTPSAPSRR